MNLKELFKLNPLRFTAGLSFQALVAIAGTFSSYLLTLQFDMIRKYNLRMFLIYGMAQLICWGVSYLALYLSDSIWQKHIQNYLHLIRQDLTDHYFEENKQQDIAHIQNRLTNDLTLLKDNYLISIRYITGMVAGIIMVTISLLTFQWTLLVACVIFAAVQIYLPKVMDKSLQKATILVSEANKKYLKALGDWLIGLSEIRRYFAFDYAFKKIMAKSDQVEQANVNKQKVDQEMDYLNQLAYSIGDMLIFLLAAILVVNKLAVFGVLASIGNFSSDLFGSLQGIADYIGKIRSTSSLRNEILTARQKVVNKKAKSLKQPAAFITKNLAIAFNNGEGVSFPDIKVKPGEKILLTGDSGVGKSTLFKLILGEEKPSSGKIKYLDKNSDEIKPDLSKVTYLPQNPILFPASIIDNITMFDNKLSAEVNSAIEQVQLVKDITKFSSGIETKINLDKLNISGGQRQKIVLARNEIHHSKLILIDEGTSAIDQKATQMILNNLIKTDATIMFIAHNFNLKLRKLFDREIHLEKNKE